ncbi:MAG TPA: dihydropyrimidinase [Candidatus Binataceae bacterium]|nr:dihydropyrimidinase [Candidatus Binataceae bacterium]
MLDLAIVGGSAVTPGKVAAADLGISDGRIVTIAAPGGLEAATRTIDASGMLVLPGAVDPHTHLDAQMHGARSADDFHSGTVAAAAGGVTTIIDYAFQRPGGSLVEAIGAWQEKAHQRAVIDYGLHIAVIDPSAAAIEELPRAVDRGCPSFKVFMMRRFEERARDFLKLFAAAAQNGGLMTVHAEDENIINFCTQRLIDQGKTAAQYFADSRPPLSEAAAVSRALGMAELTGAATYFVHLSSAAALDEIRRAREAGRTVLAETRPIYLYLTEELLRQPDGVRFVGHPPLRTGADRDALWRGLADGTIDVVATDHCSWTLKEKRAAENFTRLIPGMANLETLVPMLYSEGVVSGRISIERMVELVATNPAKIFGLYPRKGVIARGADADLVIFDPHQTVVVHQPEMHSGSDYDPFEGVEVRGWPRTTLSRGEVIVDHRKPHAAPGRGRFVPRAPFDPGWRDA